MIAVTDAGRILISVIIVIALIQVPREIAEFTKVDEEAQKLRAQREEEKKRLREKKLEAANSSNTITTTTATSMTSNNSNVAASALPASAMISNVNNNIISSSASASNSNMSSVPTAGTLHDYMELRIRRNLTQNEIIQLCSVLSIPVVQGQEQTAALKLSQRLLQ